MVAHIGRLALNQEINWVPVSIAIPSYIDAEICFVLGNHGAKYTGLRKKF